MKIAAALLALCIAVPGAWAGEPDAWEGYLDYAYVYSSAEAAPLRDRLASYGNEAGQTLEQYIARHYAPVPIETDAVDEVTLRRRAVAYLLDYIARSDPDSLARSVEAARALEPRLERHENRYWYRYILAHEALEKGRRFDFVAETLALWSEVVVPLESTYETLQTLSLDDSANAGFAAALPYVYENVARLILVRTPQMGVDRDLDPLAGIVRLLLDGRAGAHPDTIPVAASSKDHLERIVARLDGPESDAGSLTFTLALFEATRYHERARGLLATEGFSGDTLEAVRITSGAYQTAYERASLPQGKVAVTVRVLRQLGELYAARQRLGVDPEIVTPFQLEEAYELYGVLRDAEDEGDLRELGYGQTGAQAHVEAMRGLWSEIQEATLNAADYYLFRSVENPHRAYENSRAAARLYARYLTFFLEYANADDRSGVPDSAYFAAHEAAKGVADAYLLYDSHPTRAEIAQALSRYRAALQIFPFDRSVWSALAAALERQGRESDYLELVNPVAAAVTRSRSLDTWIAGGEAEAARVAVLRRACSDPLVLFYLGFAEGSGVESREEGVDALRAERSAAAARLERLIARRDDTFLGRDAVPASLGEGPAAGELDAAQRAALHREIEQVGVMIERLNRQIEARSRTLPLYRETLATDGLAQDLRARRDHPLHTLLRRMYHESQG